jgi:hypothetical protein
MCEHFAVEDPIDAQVAAYNAHDIAAFSACYTDDIVVTDARGTPVIEGKAAFRERYGRLFDSSPDLRAQIASRVTAGAWTVDEEVVRRAGEQVHVLVAYELRDGLICRMMTLSG